jgi:hypothetical protein
VSCDKPVSVVTISLSLRPSLSPNPGHAKESRLTSSHVASLHLVKVACFDLGSASTLGSWSARLGYGMSLIGNCKNTSDSPAVQVKLL